MSYQISWLADYEGRIVHVTFTGELTIEDLEGLRGELTGYLNTGTAPVHILHNVSGVTKFPNRISQLRSVSRGFNDAAMGWTVVVGGTTLMNLLSSIFSQLTTIRIRAVSTQEEALAVLKQEDPTLVA